LIEIRWINIVKEKTLFYKHEAHYNKNIGPVDEYADKSECEMKIKNIGWTLGNACPYRCLHCYSMSARRGGRNLNIWMIERIISQLLQLGVKTVNLGGNEPFFTNGLNIKKTLLPYIIESLVNVGIRVGLTTSGISLILLKQHYPSILKYLNDVDVSLDSPFEDEHNKNRGANIFVSAIEALRICASSNIECTIIMTGMAWNFSKSHLRGILSLSKKYNANIRINTIKPVEHSHMLSMMSSKLFYQGFSYLISKCNNIEIGEPCLAAACGLKSIGCACGQTSFRIHSITPSGEVPVSPCVYLHDYKAKDLLKDDIFDIVYSPQFKAFRRRVKNPSLIDDCQNCKYLDICRGGCSARSYLYNLHTTGKHSLFVKDPYCLRDCALNDDFPRFLQRPSVDEKRVLVHKNYLCTWIGSLCKP
jgi:radical SAM protein with 4Fe4S-binding SPASM domain